MTTNVLQARALTNNTTMATTDTKYPQVVKKSAKPGRLTWRTVTIGSVASLTIVATFVAFKYFFTNSSQMTRCGSEARPDQGQAGRMIDMAKQQVDCHLFGARVHNLTEQLITNGSESQDLKSGSSLISPMISQQQTKWPASEVDNKRSEVLENTVTDTVGSSALSKDSAIFSMSDYAFSLISNHGVCLLSSFEGLRHVAWPIAKWGVAFSNFAACELYQSSQFKQHLFKIFNFGGVLTNLDDAIRITIGNNLSDFIYSIIPAVVSNRFIHYFLRPEMIASNRFIHYFLRFAEPDLLWNLISYDNIDEFLKRHFLEEDENLGGTYMRLFNSRLEKTSINGLFEFVDSAQRFLQSRGVENNDPVSLGILTGLTSIERRLRVLIPNYPQFKDRLDRFSSNLRNL